MTCKVASLRGGVTPIMPMILMGIARSRLTDWPPAVTVAFFDGLNRSQTSSRGEIDLATPIDDDTVIALCLLHGDQTIEHVVEHALRIALARIAKTAAAGQMQLDGIARRHGLPALWPDRAARTQRHGAGSAGLAAVAAARRVFHPFEVAQQRDRIGAGAADFDHLAEPTPALAGAAGAFAKLAAIEHHRRHALGGFHGDRAHAGRKRGCAQAVF